MSSHVGASSVNGSSSVGGSGSEDASEENRNNETPSMCFKVVRPRLKSPDPAGEGRSSGVEQLVRPNQPGRKAQKKTHTEEHRGRWRDGNQERNEERLSAEHLGGRERGKQRQRKERTVTHGNGAQDRQGGESIESLSSSNSDVQPNSASRVGEGSNNLQRGHTRLRPQCTNCTRTLTSNSSSQSLRPAFQTRSIPPSPQRHSSRPVAADPQAFSIRSIREPDPFWTEVRSGTRRFPYGQTHIPPIRSSGHEEEEEEDDEEDDENVGSSGVMEVMGQTVTSAVVLPCVSIGERRMSKRERNRIKSLKRRQRRREKWRQSQQQEGRQSSTGNPSSSSSSCSSEDDEALRDREGYVCAVCLDVYFSPYMCQPCNHIFCEPCLRTLAKNNPTNTPCPLCRTIITHVFFQKGFQRQSNPIARRQFPLGAGYRLDDMDYEDDSRGWRFDMDMVIIYIYSVNWIIGFFIFCFLCYLFFPSL